MEQLVNFETSKLAKEVGFDWTCHSMYRNQNNPQLEEYNEMKVFLYSDYVPAPTQSLLQKWLRDEYGIHIDFATTTNSKWDFNLCNLREGVGHAGFFSNSLINFDTYELALEAGLQEALKLVISKNSQGGN